MTGDHYIPLIAQAIDKAVSRGFDLPFIFNCSGYEKPESLKMLDGLIDVYLPDFKYMDPALAAILSVTDVRTSRTKDGYLRVVILYENVKEIQPEALYKAAKAFDALNQNANAERMRTKLRTKYAQSEYARKL